ncbi:MAG: hypothetical protein IPH86_11995 [bacterium]|nr:hypothetical protein [bacterium]
MRIDRDERALPLPTSFRARLWPRAGQRLELPGGSAAAWTVTAAPGGSLTLPAASGADPRWAVAATYLTSTAFTGGKLTIRGTQPFSAWLDGQKLVDRARADSSAAEVTADLKLTQGKHALVVYTLSDPRVTGRLDAGCLVGGRRPGRCRDPSGALTTPEHPVRIRDYLDTQAVSGIQLSATGELVAITLRRPEVPSESGETWVEIRRAADGALVRTIRGDHAGSFTWGASGQRCSYVTQRDGKSTLWLDDLAGGLARAAARRGALRRAPLAARQPGHRLHAGRGARQGSRGLQTPARADRPLGRRAHRGFTASGHGGRRGNTSPDRGPLVLRRAGRERRRQRCCSRARCATTRSSPSTRMSCTNSD